MAIPSRYLDRWNDDIKWSAGAFALSLIVVFPVVYVGAKYYWGMIYLYLCLFGLLNVFFFCGLTAAFDNLIWKAAVYLPAALLNVGAFNGMIFFDPRQYGSSETNTGGLMIVQLLISFPIFYLLVRRAFGTPWPRVRRDWEDV